MTPAPYSCVLLTSDHEHLAHSAQRFAEGLFDVRFVSRQSRAQKTLPAECTRVLLEQRVDFLFNFLSPVILPAALLAGARKAAINFHPAPPEWPGIGSASFALFEDATQFGATAHVMTAQVDAGTILRVQRFPIAADDTCEHLFARSLDCSLELFRSLLADLAATGQVTPCGETWGRKAVTRKQFETWMTVAPTDPVELIRRKERALRHSRFPGPFMQVAGLRFELPPRHSA